MIDITKFYNTIFSIISLIVKYKILGLVYSCYYLNKMKRKTGIIRQIPDTEINNLSFSLFRFLKIGEIELWKFKDNKRFFNNNISALLFSVGVISLYNLNIVQ